MNTFRRLAMGASLALAGLAAQAAPATLDPVDDGAFLSALSASLMQAPQAATSDSARPSLGLQQVVRPGTTLPA